MSDDVSEAIFEPHLERRLRAGGWPHAVLEPSLVGVRASNALARRGVRTVEQLLRLPLSDLMSTPAFGNVALLQLRNGLRQALEVGPRVSALEMLLPPAVDVLAAAEAWSDVPLDVDGRGEFALSQAGLEQLGDVAGMTLAAFDAVPGSGAALIRKVRGVVARTIGIPDLHAAPSRPQPFRPVLLADLLRTSVPTELDRVAPVLPLIAGNDPRFGHPVLAGRQLDAALAHPTLDPYATIENVLVSALRRLDAFTQRPQPLLDELRDLLPGRNEREEMMAAELWGWDGAPPRTFDEVGRKHRVSRARAHQIVKPIEARIRQVRPYLPTALRLVELIDELGGAVREGEWGQVAAARGLVVKPGDVAALRSLPQLGLLPSDALLRLGGRHAEGVVGRDATEVKSVARLQRQVEQEIGRWGVARPSQIARALAMAAVPATEIDVIDACRRARTVRFLDRGRHIARPDTVGSSVAWRVRLPLQLVGPQTTAALHAGVLRANRGRTEHQLEFGLEVLEEFLRLSPLADLREGWWHWSGSEATIGGVEAAIVRVFRERGANAITAPELHHAIPESEWSYQLVSIALRSTPLLVAPRPRVFALLGTRPSDEDLDSAIERAAAYGGLRVRQTHDERGLGSSG